MFMIKEMPNHERPRERFLKYPHHVLSDTELLAITLRTGSKDESVIELSKRIMVQYRSLKALSVASIEELTKIKGIGKNKAIQLQTAFILGKRVYEEKFISNKKLKSPESVYLYMKDQLELKTQEHLVCLYLNAKGELLEKRTLFIGSLTSSLVHPREVFKYAVRVSAAGFILVHNHPSGDPTPSFHDKDVTISIKELSTMMDIELYDHVIIGRDKYFSFKEKQII